MVLRSDADVNKIEMKNRLDMRDKIASDMPKDTFFILDPKKGIDSNVFYLTGARFPGVALAFFKGKTGGDYYLFVPQTTAEEEVWQLPLPRREAVIRNMAGHVGSLKVMDKKMMEGIVARQKKGLKEGDNDVLENRIAQFRMVKTDMEINRMLAAANATEYAFRSLMMGGGLEGRREKSVRYLIDSFLVDGALEDEEAGPAFPTIVATPEHALCLHYDFSSEGSSMGDRVVTKRDYIVVDAGARVSGYCCDVTRTIPISKRSFRGYRRGLYEALLLAQKRLVSGIKPRMTFGELNMLMAEEIFDALKSEGALTRSARSDPVGAHTEAMWRLMQHGIGHPVGVDFHDAVYYDDLKDRKDGKAKEKSGALLYDPFRYVSGKVAVPNGAVITVEPGIYVTKDSKILRQEYGGHGLGMRIEDTILVTDSLGTCNVNLTKGIPKEISKLEKMC